MSTTLVLATPDFSKPFVIECDASRFRIGATLMQDGHPIPFEIRKLNKRECLKSTYDKKILAIMHALAKWRQYLLGSTFFIHRDHNSPQHILQQKDTFYITTKMDRTNCHFWYEDITQKR